MKSLVLELEHGTFDLSTLDQFLAYTKALGMPVLTKIPRRTPSPSSRRSISVPTA